MRMFYNFLIIKEFRIAQDTNRNKLIEIFDSMRHQKNLIKFPILYQQFYENFNEILMGDRDFESIENPVQVFKNLLYISNIRKLKDIEEK